MSVEEQIARFGSKDQALELAKNYTMIQKAQYYDDPVQKYVNSNSLRLHPAQEKLIKVRINDVQFRKSQIRIQVS